MKKYIGWRGSGKSYNIISDALADIYNENKRVLIIVPTNTLALIMMDKVKHETRNDYPGELTIISASNARVLDFRCFDSIYIDELSLCLEQLGVSGYSDTNYDNYD